MNLYVGPVKGVLVRKMSYNDCIALGTLQSVTDIEVFAFQEGAYNMSRMGGGRREVFEYLIKLKATV